jgi:hypothetical protein
VPQEFCELLNNVAVRRDNAGLVNKETGAEHICELGRTGVG